MSALFHIDALLRCVILLICTVTYVRQSFPSAITKQSKGFYSVTYKLSVIGDRLSPYIAVFCFAIGCAKIIGAIF
jgi:hypothetical protein